jgi:hypothetical protein
MNLAKAETVTTKPKAKSGVWILYSLLALVALSGAVYLIGHLLYPIAQKTLGVYCY